MVRKIKEQAVNVIFAIATNGPNTKKERVYRNLAGLLKGSVTVVALKNSTALVGSVQEQYRARFIILMFDVSK